MNNPPDLDRKKIAEKYGPWAVIAGGSDGTGEAYARELAAAGVNVMLVSRRGEVLDALAKDLQAKHGIETRTLVQDLMEPDAADNILKASEDLDVGLYISNAGVDGTGAKFFDQPLDRWLRMMNMNVRTVTTAVYAFGNRLRKRGRGGILLMSSSSGLGGTPYLSMYSATKSFELVLAEALWGELQDSGVDIVVVIAPAMATPFFQKNIAGEGFKLGGLIFSPEEVAQKALAQLGHSPVIMFRTARRQDPDKVVKERYDELLGSLEAGRSFFPKSEKEAASS
jgi:short-subunit dehydrogenase